MAGLVLVGAVVGVVPVGTAVADVVPEGAMGVEVVGAAKPPVGLLGPEGAALPGGLEGPVVPDMIQKGMATSRPGQQIKVRGTRELVIHRQATGPITYGNLFSSSVHVGKANYIEYYLFSSTIDS
jgi:hypothetical protein